MNFQNQIDYLQDIKNEDMFAGVSVPTPLEAETLKSQIVFRCGLLTPVYTEPQIMQAAITQFFQAEQWNISHLINIILAEYSPIENTDKYSQHTTTDSGTGSTTLSGTDSKNITNSGTDEKDIKESGTTTDTREVSAYNSSGYQADNKETVAHGKKIDEDITFGKIVAEQGTTSRTTTKNDSGSSSYTEHTHGNIGVTTNQQMIQEELELLEAFDVYDWIASKLEKELFLQVY